MSARHDFEQVVFIGWLSNKILSEYVLHSTIGVCPNENIEGLSTVLSESVQMKYIEGLPTVLSESVQMKYIGGLSTVLSESVQIKIYIYIYIYIEGWSNILSESVQRTFARTKTKTFCIKNNFHTWQKCM